jgi:hypothetical protein
MKIIENEISCQVVSKSGYVSLIAKGVVFQNIGDDTATINGTITILPRASFMFSMSTESDLIVQKLKIMFAGVGPNPRLEVIEILPKDPEIAHYIRSKKHF